MTGHIITLIFVFYLTFTLIYGKESSASLRGSGEASVKQRKQYQRESSVNFKHEIRRYLQPEELMTLSLWDYMDHVDKTYSGNDEYSRFRSLVAAADRKDDLNFLTGITLLAPNNDAISREIKDFLLESDNKYILQEIVEYHMIPWVVSFLSPEFKRNSKVTTFTVAGENIDISVNKNGLLFNKHAHAIAYALANESLLYKIDRLLIPPSMNSEIPEEVLLTNSKKTDNKTIADKAYELPIVIPDGFLVEVGANTDDVAVQASVVPSTVISDSPSTMPSDAPSSSPSDSPSMIPSDAPSMSPSLVPSTVPSDIPSMFPVESSSPNIPSIVAEDSIGSSSSPPSQLPSSSPSDVPSSIPSSVPSSIPSTIPSSMPSHVPSSIPSIVSPFALINDTTRAPTFFWVFFSPGGIKRNSFP